MNQSIRSILDELYALEPTLRAQEQELIPLLEKMMKAKPNVEPDPAFVQRLQMLLKERAAAAPTRTSPFSFLTMPNFNYAITGAVLGAVITGPIVYAIIASGGLAPVPVMKDGDNEPLFSYSVEETSDQAFGNLGSPALSVTSGRGQAGGGGSVPTPMAAESSNEAVATDAAQKMMAPDIGLLPYEITEYNFTIDGDIPELTAQEVDILKRQKGISSPGIGSVLGSFDTGLIDMNTFDNAKVDSINFYQDTQFGYMFSINFREGSLSINANWEKWPHPEQNCSDEACYNRYRLDINDIPSDDALIAIANDFMSDHNVDLSRYGQPEVNNLWRRDYANTPNKSEFYVPDAANVVYPLLIEGQPVYDEGGTKAGISVGVNVREKRVSDAWGIMDQKFIKSAYPAVTDKAQIIAFLDTFGDMQKQWMPEGAKVKTVNITLGAPTIGYTRMYVYDEDKGMGDELIVPALIFPVKNVPAGDFFYRDTVTVPLAQELLEKTNQPIVIPEPRPLMLEDGGPAVDVPADNVKARE